MSQQASHHLYALIFQYLTLRDIKNCLFLDRRFNHHSSYYIKNCLNLALNIPRITNDILFLKDLNNLKSLTINCLNLGVKKINIILQQIPKQIRKLHILVEIQTLCHQKIFYNIPKYIGQIQQLKITLFSDNMKQQQQENVRLEIQEISNQFYRRMKNVKKFKLDSFNLSSVNEFKISSLFYYALYFKSDQVQSLPQIESVAFGCIVQYGLLWGLQNSNLHQNPYIKSLSIKQKGQPFGINIIDHIQYFLIGLLPQTLRKLVLTQHTQQNLTLQPSLYHRLIHQFQQLECLKINIYQGSFSFGSIFEHSQIEKTNGSLKQLGLASIRCHPWYVGQLVIKNPEIKVLNLDFTQLDDNFLHQIHCFQLTELTIRGNTHLNPQSLDSFFSSQTQLRVLDVRGVYTIKKKTFKSIIKNNLIEKLKLSDNKFDNKVYMMMLKKFQNCLKSLHLGSLNKNNNFTPDILQQAQFRILGLLSLTIQFSYTGFSLNDLSYLLATFPNITNLHLNIQQGHGERKHSIILAILEKLSTSITKLRIEKLTINDNNLYGFKSGQVEYKQTLIKLKDVFPFLKIIIINSQINYSSEAEILQKEGIFAVYQGY